MFFQDKNIFIIENNDICQRLYQELFTMVPCKMRLFESAEGVLDAAKQELPDIIIMDIGLPKISGLELTKQLKADTLTADIPVLAVTAFALPEDEENIQRAGCDGALNKPFKIDELLDRMQKLLSK